MLNRIILMGRLVADPELRTTPAGVTVATFRVACDRDFRNKQTGERETDFINIVVWRQTAEFVSRYFTKGRMAIVEGRLQIRNYTDRDGNKRNVAEVVADSVYFGDSRKDGEGGGYTPAPYGAPAGSFSPPPQAPGGGYAPPAADDQFAELADPDGDLPF